MMIGLKSIQVVRPQQTGTTTELQDIGRPGNIEVTEDPAEPIGWIGAKTLVYLNAGVQIAGVLVLIVSQVLGVCPM